MLYRGWHVGSSPHARVVPINHFMYPGRRTCQVSTPVRDVSSPGSDMQGFYDCSSFCSLRLQTGMGHVLDTPSLDQGLASLGHLLQPYLFHRTLTSRLALNIGWISSVGDHFIPNVTRAPSLKQCFLGAWKDLCPAWRRQCHALRTIILSLKMN
jgi:hypothetical protein